MVGEAPEDVAVELTNRCNLRCDDCPQSDPGHFERVPRTTLRLEHVESVVYEGKNKK